MDDQKKERKHACILKQPDLLFLPILPKYNQPEAYLATTGLHRFLYRGCQDDAAGSQTVWTADPMS